MSGECQLPKGLIAAWPACTLEERFRQCLLLFTLHGVLPDAEADRIRHRIERRLKKRKIELEQEAGPLVEEATNDGD